MKELYKVVCALSNSAVFDDLEWPRTPVSRSQLGFERYRYWGIGRYSPILGDIGNWAICVLDAVPDAIFAVTQTAAGAAQWISISYVGGGRRRHESGRHAARTIEEGLSPSHLSSSSPDARHDRPLCGRSPVTLFKQRVPPLNADLIHTLQTWRAVVI